MECCVCLDEKEEFIFIRKCKCIFHICKECFDTILNNNHYFKCVYCNKLYTTNKNIPIEGFSQVTYIYLDVDERRNFSRNQS
jgi:hypothetical protein